MKVAVLREQYSGERRVALVPANVPMLAKAGVQVMVQAGAGQSAGYRDQDYEAKGASIAADASAAVRDAQVIAVIRLSGSLPGLQAEHCVIGMCDPLGAPQAIADFAGSRAALFSLELIPRITRAQSMDVLSSQATIAGYRAVLLAAVELSKMFPLLMTAAGTLTAAKVFVIGAGVAGLQAIATARRLGAVVHGYDVRAACREQVESLGAKFVELNIETAAAEGQGGYAKAMDEDFYRRQRELLGEVVAASDVVITTAAIPGKPSPLLVTADAVRKMAAGSVIMDLAAERGGNCELSKPDQRVVDSDVIILGPTNLPSEIPRDASQMFGNNVTKFLLNMIKDGRLVMNLDDEIVRETLVACDGQVVLPRVRQLLGLPAEVESESSADAEVDTDAATQGDES